MTGPQTKSKKSLVLATALLSAGGIGFWMYSTHAKAMNQVANEGEKPLVMVHLDPFVVNLADTDEKDYLRVGIDLGVESAEKDHKSESRIEPTPMMRDAIISVLSTRHCNELLTPEGKQKLKQDLIAALKAQTITSNVREIYFNEFLVQR